MTVGDTLVVTAAVQSIYDRPSRSEGKVERQAIAGDRLIVTQMVSEGLTNAKGSWAKIAAEKDSYEGFVECTFLRPATVTATHSIAVRETPVTQEPEVKFGPSDGMLFMGSKVCVVDWSEDREWARVQLEQDDPIGWVFARHLRPIDENAGDPVGVARAFLGTPYVWGGNTGRGIDCSGLVQAALLACGIPCLGDSGPQQDVFAEPDREGPFVAGELLFWSGHVAMATTPDTMIHATAYSMSVIEEPIEPALQRIASQGDAPWQGRGRPR